jgi:squalene-hopene/tetraprenyl-beta-curcumene cyclase
MNRRRAMLAGAGAALVMLPALAAPPAPRPSAAGGGAAPAAARLRTSVNRGLAYLRKSQQRDGSWQNYPGITAVCVLGFLRNGVGEKDPAVARACAYLASLAKPNGAIYTDRLGPAQALPNYNTALAMTALHLTRNPRYAPIVRKAQQFLATSQYDEGEGFTPKDRQYGGIGYGSREDNPDVSNLQNALEALRETGYPKDGDVFKKAITFLQRAQNRAESNDQAWAGNDGGFVYASSGESKADEYTRGKHSSYGSMTYAGVKSYLYCNVTRTDPRVVSAWGWLRANYSVTENPRMGSDGLYYYYHTMSKTLSVWGDRVFVDNKGQKRVWARDLSAAIIGRQKADGSWTNANARWRENDPALVTGYALVSLANCAGKL